MGARAVAEPGPTELRRKRGLPQKGWASPGATHECRDGGLLGASRDDAETMQRRGGDDEACHGAHPGAAVICRHGSQLASLPPKGDRPICSSSSPIIQGLACSWPGRLRILRICHPKPLILGPATSCRKPQRRWRCAFWSSHLCDARAASRPLTCAACCWIPGSPSVPCLFHRKHLNLAISFVDGLG